MTSPRPKNGRGPDGPETPIRRLGPECHPEIARESGVLEGPDGLLTSTADNHPWERNQWGHPDSGSDRGTAEKHCLPRGGSVPLRSRTDPDRPVLEGSG